MAVKEIPRILAVYGTLKVGYHNHRFIEGAGLRFIGRLTTTENKFTLRGGEAFPVVYEGGEEHILCELFEFKKFTQLNRIDSLEQHPKWYQRKLFEFTNGRQAWMYVQKFPEKGDVNRARVKLSKGVAQWI